ncbi:MAG: acyl-CoA carboxylase subunit epsilon, partial [Actinomycetota bacterium]|nr:acyl-CoA carboxylase subunit epsilon [Actinomycetota bacterium]
MRGNPTDEELAALVAVVAARQAAAGADWVGGTR